MLAGIITGTPIWVWLLLAGLIALGAVQLRDRQMSRMRLLILPLVLVLLSLFSVGSAFELAPAALIGWIVGGTLAVAAMRQAPKPAGGMRSDGLYDVPGSWWPLALILSIFSIRYATSVSLAIDPSLRQVAAVQAGAGLFSGVFSGIFLGRAFSVLGIRRGPALVRWALGMVALAALPIAIALALVALPTPPEETALAKPAEELAAFVKATPRLEPAPAEFFKARDGAERLYRRYDGAGQDALIFFHGSTGESRYLAHLAKRVANQTGVTVITMDMRGHGSSPVRRGDLDYVGQQEDDIADLIGSLRERNFKRIFIGGHSLGGGLAIRYAAGQQQPRPDGVILLAPFINQASPAAFPEAGGWATAFVKRFVGLSILHRYHVTALDSLPVIRFRTPPSSRDGTETTLYSWRLWTSLAPRSDWKADIAAIDAPTLVVGAANDSIFRSAGYPEVFKPAKNADVQIIPELSHFQIVVDDRVIERVVTWLRSVQAEQAPRVAKNV
jgi:alpha-beta hydrolase superfamily lysophospholipase